MFILTVSILLLMVHHSQSAMSAKAVLYGDNSQISYGTLMFDQDNARAPVRITGRLTGLNASSAHVGLIIRKKKKNKVLLVGISCSCKSCIRWFTKLYSRWWSF